MKGKEGDIEMGGNKREVRRMGDGREGERGE